MMLKLFQLMDRLMAHWNKKWGENSWYFFIMFGQMFAFVVAIFLITRLIASALVKIVYFSTFQVVDIWLILLSIFIASTFVFAFAHDSHTTKEEKKAKERLANRSLTAYVEKYQKYVDLVDGLLQTRNYKNVCLSEDWVKDFDRNLTDISHRCRKTKKIFSDFTIAACLMYRLISADSKDHIAFAFDCIKKVVSYPAIYNCKYLDGGELILEVQKTYDPVDFSVLKPEQVDFVLSLFECYYSQIDTYDRLLELADFLQILGMYCDNQQ